MKRGNREKRKTEIKGNIRWEMLIKLMIENILPVTFWMNGNPRFEMCLWRAVPNELFTLFSSCTMCFPLSLSCSVFGSGAPSRTSFMLSRPPFPKPAGPGYLRFPTAVSSYTGSLVRISGPGSGRSGGRVPMVRLENSPTNSEATQKEKKRRLICESEMKKTMDRKSTERVRWKEGSERDGERVRVRERRNREED